MKNFTFFVILLMASPLLSLSQCPTDAGPNHTICNNYGFNSLTIGPRFADPSYSYTWSPDISVVDPNDPDPTVVPQTTTTYTMTVDGPGCSGTYTTTVYVTGFINITAPNGTIEHPVTYNDLYFLSGTTPPSIVLHSDVSGDWYKNSGTYIATGTTYTYTPSSTTAEDPVFYIATRDGQGNSCAYTDLLYFTTHPVSSVSGFPVPVYLNYSPHFGGCGLFPYLPGTITQTTSLGSGTTYDWAFTAGSTGNWSFTSVSGNTATLNHNSATKPDPVTITTRAINTSYWAGSGQSDWVIWTVTDNSSCTTPTVNNRVATGTGAQLDASTAKTTLYPNPANSFITVSAPDLIKTIEITSLSGMTAKRITPGKTKFYNVTTSDLPSGAYVCKLMLADNTIQYLQFVIAR